MHETLNAVFHFATFILIVMTRTSMNYPQSIGYYPYITSVQHRQLEQYCTGTIITEMHVLSTFTCGCHYHDNVTNIDPDTNRTGWVCYNPESFIVVAGISGKYMDLTSGQVRRVEKFMVTNDSYYPPNSTHFADFSVILVKDPFRFRASIQRMPLLARWEKDRIKASLMKASSSQNIQHKCFTIGWDFISSGIQVSMLTVLPTQIAGKCDFDYCDINRNQSHCVPYCEQPNICGTFRTDVRYCNGLTGNVLLCGEQDQIIVGLTSIPANCEDPRKKVPTVYIRMDKMLEFVSDIREASKTLALRTVLWTHFITQSIIIFFYNYTYYCDTHEQLTPVSGNFNLAVVLPVSR